MIFWQITRVYLKQCAENASEAPFKFNANQLEMSAMGVGGKGAAECQEFSLSALGHVILQHFGSCFRDFNLKVPQIVVYVKRINQ